MTKLSPRSQESHQTVSKETTVEDPSSGGDASRVPAFKKTAGSASSEETLTSPNETLPTDVPEAATSSAVVKRSRDDSADANDSVEDGKDGDDEKASLSTTAEHLGRGRTACGG
ncbi:hypothetical protein MTO96_050101 [Rhipicephalus appendiculatus]